MLSFEYQFTRFAFILKPFSYASFLWHYLHISLKRNQYNSLAVYLISTSYTSLDSTQPSKFPDFIYSQFLLIMQKLKKRNFTANSTCLVTMIIFIAFTWSHNWFHLQSTIVGSFFKPEFASDTLIQSMWCLDLIYFSPFLAVATESYWATVENSFHWCWYCWQFGFPFFNII